MPALSQKMPSTAYLRTRQVMAFVLAGTAVRLGYGCFTQAWLGSPDQLAWALDLDAMIQHKTWSYIQLTHAPHEGASSLLSIFSILFRPFDSLLPSLTFVALLLDAMGRFVQIRVAQKFFGNETASWFAWWSVLAVPVLIPWGTVNFGLHSILSFVPFVFCWMYLKYQHEKYFPALCAIACGIAVSLSYNSIVLVVTAIFFFLFEQRSVKRKMQRLLLFFIVLFLSMLPHMLARIFFDHETALAIRGISVLPFNNWQPIVNLYSVWFTSLPGSFLLLPGRIVCGIMFLFLFIGMSFYISKTKQREKYIPVVIVFVFVTAYAFSPFYGKEYGVKSYVYYRHLTYIIPLLVAILIHGFVAQGAWKKIMLASWLFVCGTATVYYLANAKKASPAYKAAGWILAKKYENATGTLFAIPSVTPVQYRQELIGGFGWGLGASVLQGNDSAAVEKLVVLIRNAPIDFQDEMRKGVRHAFDKGVTPVLNSALLAEVDSRFSIQTLERR